MMVHCLNAATGLEPAGSGDDQPWPRIVDPRVEFFGGKPAEDD